MSMTVSVVVPLSIVVLTAAVQTLTSSTDYGTSGRYSLSHIIMKKPSFCLSTISVSVSL